MELFSEEVKKEHLTDKFIIIKKKGIRANYPYGIRNSGGYVLLFTQTQYYQGQGVRFKEEMEEIWIIARKTLNVLNL